MNLRYLSLTLILVLCIITGCSKNVRVQGKISFEDGTPLSNGTVVFDNGQTSARGKLNEDGTYQIGSLKSNDGLLPGSYKVFIIGALNGMPASPAGNPGQAVGFGEMPDSKASNPSSDIQFLIHPKYGNRNTTDLSIEVTSSTREANFTVERPEQ